MTHEYEEALSYLQESLKLINADDTTVINSTKDTITKINKLIASQEKREKSTWSKAFKKNNEELEMSNTTLTSKATDTDASIQSDTTANGHSVTPVGDSNVTLDITSTKILSNIIDDNDDKEDDDTNNLNKPDSTNSASMIANIVLITSAVAIAAFFYTKFRKYR